MDALTKQSIQRLCERLGAFRLRGPIPALMAEYPVGTPEEDRPPLGGLADTLVSNVLRELPDGSRFVRSVWLAGSVAHFPHCLSGIPTEGSGHERTR